MWHWLMATPAGSVVFLALGLLLFVLLYFLPSILGFILQVQSPVLLTFVNALLGWTVLGWIACLVWAPWRSREDSTFDEDRIEPTL